MENVQGQENVSESLESMTLPNPLELLGSEFKRISIIGVGLIGGSIGLRMRAMGLSSTITGHDQPGILDEAIGRGAIDRGVGDLAEAVTDADLIILATPIEETAKLLPSIMKMASADAVVTDTAPAKAELYRLAKDVEGARACYIGGHPLAGSNHQGIASADASLFENAYWLLTPTEDVPQHARESLWWWVRLLGAYPQTMEPDVHDRIVAMTTHVPVIIAIALSNWIAQQSNTIPVLPKLATGHFQSMTSLAALPLAVWEAVLKYNRAEVATGIESFRTVFEQCAREYQEDRLSEIWQSAHALQRKLNRERPGDWDANCEVVVTVPDRPGAIAKIASLLATHSIGIRDIHVIYVRERRGGRLAVVLESRAEARRAMDTLMADGYSVRLRD